MSTFIVDGISMSIMTTVEVSTLWPATMITMTINTNMVDTYNMDSTTNTSFGMVTLTADSVTTTSKSMAFTISTSPSASVNNINSNKIIVSTMSTSPVLMTTGSSTISRVSLVDTKDNAIMTVTSTVTASSVDTSIITPIKATNTSLSATPEISSNEPPITETSTNESADSSVGIIVGCVVGIIFCFALTLLVIILICYYIKSNRAKFVIAQGM